MALSVAQRIDRKKMSTEERRSEISRVAADLFNEAGYIRTSMDDIAAVAGIKKSTLYHYFRSKSDLLCFIHEEFIDGLIERQSSRLTLGMPAPEILRAVVNDFFENISTRPGHCRTFFENHRELPDNQQAASQQKRTLYESMVEDTVLKGVASGEFREVDPRLFVLALFGMSNWSYQWYRQDGKLTAAEIADTFWEYLYVGLRP